MPAAHDQQARLLATIEQLLEMPAAEKRTTLTGACDLVAAALDADKVDAFFYDDERDSLSSLGTSNQPLSAFQRKHGLDVLPLANGGRAVQVFRTHATYASGSTRDDPEELKGIREVLRVASQIGAPLPVGDSVRGVLLVCSQKPSFFTTEDVRFVETVARWVGAVAHRADLVERIGREAAESARRHAAEELVTVLAHDLRNYIQPIDGRLQLVQRRLERENLEADLRDIDLARRGLSRLTALISDILDVARIDQGALVLETEPVDVVQLAKDVGAMLATAQTPIDVTAAEQVVATIDASRIRRCLENLLTNALKHSPRGAPVHVTVARRESAEGEQVRIEIIDEGPGISHDLVPHIFDRFVTARARSGGLGLGLFFAKNIATAHGGDLVVAPPEPGRGAHFTLRFPTHPQH